MRQLITHRWFKSSPRNHECYTVQKPFAGGHNLGPGKGLRRVWVDRVDHNAIDIGVKQLPSPLASLAQGHIEFLQVSLDEGWVDLQGRALGLGIETARDVAGGA